MKDRAFVLRIVVVYSPVEVRGEYGWQNDMRN